MSDPSHKYRPEGSCDTLVRFAEDGRALLSAATGLREELVRQLLESQGVDVNARTQEGNTSLHLLAETPTRDPQLVDSCDQQECMITLQKKDTLLHLLLSSGADPNIRNAEGNTPLHVVAANELDENSVHWMKLLLEHGADPNVRNAEGNTPLHLAVFNRRFWSAAYDADPCNVEQVALLLKGGADPNAANANGETALHLIVGIPVSFEMNDAAWSIYTHLVLPGAGTSLHLRRCA